jgi:hypothetical protein
MSLKCQQLLCFFTSDTVFQFYLRLQCGGTSIEGLFKEETEQALLQELPDSDPNNSSSNG